VTGIGNVEKHCAEHAIPVTLQTSYTTTLTKYYTDLTY